jgi:hypothetical protein
VPARAVWKPPLLDRWLSADQNKNPGKQRDNAQEHDWDRDRQRGRDAVKNEKNSKQEHADVLSEVHGPVCSGLEIARHAKNTPFESSKIIADSPVYSIALPFLSRF